MTDTHHKPPPPAPADIRAHRTTAGHTQAAAAAMVYTDTRTWQKWESGTARMHPATWELYRIKTAALKNI